MATHHMRICTANEMKELDRLAEDEYQIDAQLLMENAGRAAIQPLFDHYPKAGRETEILVFAGKGNNAGDAFVVARRLICLDRKVRIFHLVEEGAYRGPTRKNFEILKSMKAKMMYLETVGDLEAFFKSSRGPFTVIDGILGTGLKGDLHGIFYDVVEMLNSQRIRQVVALDIPTGVSGDTGAIQGTSIMATLTVSFGFPKLGHFLPPGAGRRGELVNVDISLPPRFRKEGTKYLLRRDPLSILLKERDRYGHKNSFGHTLLIGGSRGRIGAITMAARACHKMGTGLVTVATWEDTIDVLMMKLPDETMVAVALKLSGPEVEEYKNRLTDYSSVVIGPGLGLRAEGKLVIEEIFGSYQGPIVVDADALNIVSHNRLHEMILRRKGHTILTPHPGEMGRLLDIPKSKVLENPLEAVKEVVDRTNAIVLVKGATTIIGQSDGIMYLNHYPNDGMATAGTGDVLAGMIGGLVGQNMDPFKGTLLAVYLHSLAGELASRKFGHRAMTAPDIIENIGNAFKEITLKRPETFPEEGRAKLL